MLTLCYCGVVQYSATNFTLGNFFHVFFHTRFLISHACLQDNSLYCVYRILFVQSNLLNFFLTDLFATKGIMKCFVRKNKYKKKRPSIKIICELPSEFREEHADIPAQNWSTVSGTVKGGKNRSRHLL